jgi:formamidopyrimidine-DNA glycosylase
MEWTPSNATAVLRNADRETLDTAVAHHKVQSVERRGKWLVVRIEHAAVVIPSA